jgi:uncharacterized repeat protein (TIGR01451 family)
MTIVLNDLPDSVAAYIRDNVTVDVSKPKTGTSSSLQPGDTADFTVNLTNKGAVRLLNVKYHLSISDPTVANFKVPPSSIGFTYRADFGDPILHGRDSDNLLVEPVLTDLSTLDPNGGTLSFGGTIDMHKKGSDLEISGHIHGDIDQTSLFPTNQRGNDSDSPKFTIQ